MIVPGLLQTAGYARAVLELVDVTGQDIAAAVAARMRRQEAL
jgi:3-hydroxyacyl-CoA dehydrogenase